MKRRKFVSSSIVAASALAVNPSLMAAEMPVGKKELYELREYEIHFGGNQNELHAYLEKALIPSMNKYGVKHVGAFKELGKSEPAKVYLLIVYPGWEEFMTINTGIKKDDEFKKASAAYNQLPPEKPVYNRINTSLMIAFDGMPNLVAPAAGPRIFEMRTYEGANEDALRRKLKMFNENEFEIFDRTKLNRVFFGELVAGKNLPCLTYMVTFKNMEERDANWAAFSADADWKKISSDPQYANNVSNIIKVFLEPTPYSQI